MFRGGRRSREAPWGDGFVDEGWDGLAGTADWGVIDADELLFLLPGLRPSGVLPQAGRDRLLPLVTAARLRAENQGRGEPMARASAAVLAHACDVLAGDAVHWREAGLVEAAILSFETGINAAYVIPSTDLLGETLAACAWAGVACRGRDALLPPVLAPALRDMLGGSPPAGHYGDVTSLVSWLVEDAGLAAPIARALEEVVRTGRICIVRGSRSAGARRNALPVRLATILDGIPDPHAPEHRTAESGTGRAG